MIIGRRVDLLLRDLQTDPAAVPLALLPPRPDLLEQGQRLARRAAVDLGLRLLVGELLPAADPGPGDLGVGHLALGVEA